MAHDIFDSLWQRSEHCRQSQRCRRLQRAILNTLYDLRDACICWYDAHCEEDGAPPDCPCEGGTANTWEDSTPALKHMCDMFAAELESSMLASSIVFKRATRQAEEAELLGRHSQ